MGDGIIEHDNIENVSGVVERTSAIHNIGDEILDSHIHDDHGDPHKAALDYSATDGKVKATTWAAVFFLSLTLVPSLNFTLNSFVPIATSVAMEIQGSLDNLNWVAGGFSLGGSIGFAVAGQMSDYLGRKDVVVVGQGFLLIGHLVGATAQNFSQIIAAMVLLGVGAGSSFVIYASISEILPNKWRAFGLATTEAWAILGSFGPVMGRVLVTTATWRWLFILGDITCLIAIGGTIIFYHPPHQIFQDRTKQQVLYELDYVGFFLYVAGVTLVLLGLGWAGSQYPWNSAAVIAPLTIGGILFLCTFAWDFSGRAARPLFPYRLFKKWREYTSLLVISFAAGLAHIALTTFVPQQILYVFTSNPITAGWYNIPSGVGALIGGTVIGGLITQVKHIPYQLLVANAIQTLACGLLSIATPERIAGGIVIQAIANLPFTWIVVLCYTTAGLHVPQRDIGLAYGLLGAFRYLGGAVGSTIFNTILSDRVRIDVPARIADAVVPLGYPAAKVGILIAALSSGKASQLPGISPDIVVAAELASRWGYSKAFSYVWYASIPFFVIACITSLFVLDPSPYFTNHTAVIATNEGVAIGERRSDAQPEKDAVQEDM